MQLDSPYMAKASKSEWHRVWRSLKVKSNNAVGLPMDVYDFLLVSSSSHVSISHPIAVTSTLKFFFPSLIRPNFLTPHTHLYPRPIFFLKIEWYPPWTGRMASTKHEVDQLNIFEIFWTWTHRHKFMQNKKPSPAKLAQRYNVRNFTITWKQWNINTWLSHLNMHLQT